MANEHLATYLNDHLAGSVVALELMEHLEAAHAGTALESFLSELRADVAEDRRELEALMSRLQVAESRTRKATAWVTEKITEVKLRLDDPAGGALRLMEALEALSLGIEGKRSMWRALATVAEEADRLSVVDYERLTARAEEQRSRVEEERLKAAKAALGDFEQAI
ncbi:MAG: hypothetical protein WBV94_09545 [Blastocatellia bacterium]